MRNRCVLLSVLFLFTTPLAAAQNQFGWLENSTADIELRKYLGTNPYGKIFSWDLEAGLDIEFVRYRSTTFSGFLRMQPVVAESYDKKIRVSGQGYRFGFSFGHRLSPVLESRVFLIHLSTHITQDVEHPFYRDVPRLPGEILDDANLIGVSLELHGTWNGGLPWRFSAAFQPITVMPAADQWRTEHYARPIFCAATLGLITLPPARLTLLAEGEFGDKGTTTGHLEMRVDLVKETQPDEGRFQIFIERYISPADVGTTPRFGFFPAEFAAGFRFVFSY